MVELYPYQKQAVRALSADKHYLIAGTGLGKTIISLDWAKRTGKKHVLVLTTAGSKV